MLRYIERMRRKLNKFENVGHIGLISVIWLLLLPATSLAAQTQSLDSIRAAVTTFVSGQTSHYNAPARIKVGRLGARLRLSRCSEQITAFQPPGTRILGNTTIGVRCSGASPWTIYVPVHVQIFQPVAMTTRPLARGDVITTADIKMVERDLSALKLGYIIDSKQPVGMVVKRRIGTDSIITPQLLEAPRLVRRGEQVAIIAESDGIEIRAVGKALADGARGDLIRVRNTASKKIIEAVVTEPGVVKVRTRSQFR